MLWICGIGDNLFMTVNDEEENIVDDVDGDDIHH
jgi:hypothetical protein